MQSMHQGTDAQTVLKAARAFAKRELRDHHYVTVLHKHQASPHVAWLKKLHTRPAYKRTLERGGEYHCA